ncbi:MAG: hypothetical protein AAGA60_24200 [Cyanobacteria bacterium P01_E01_bin.42]
MKFPTFKSTFIFSLLVTAQSSIALSALAVGSNLTPTERSTSSLTLTVTDLEETTVTETPDSFLVADRGEDNDYSDDYDYNDDYDYSRD